MKDLKKVLRERCRGTCISCKKYRWSGTDILVPHHYYLPSLHSRVSSSLMVTYKPNAPWGFSIPVPRGDTSETEDQKSQNCMSLSSAAFPGVSSSNFPINLLDHILLGGKLRIQAFSWAHCYLE